MIFIASALAQDVVLPTPPVIGIDPVLQWVMGVASVLIPGLFSVLLVFLKQKFNADKVTSDGDKIVGAAQRGAVLGAQTGATQQAAIAIGVQYIKTAVPDAVAATPQATDAHLSSIVKAVLPPVAIRNPTTGQYIRDTTPKELSP